MRWFCIFAVFLILVGCTERTNTPVPESATSIAQSQRETSSETGESERWYPSTGPQVWLKEGTLVALQDGAVLRLIDTENRLVSEIAPPPEGEAVSSLEIGENRVLGMGIVGSDENAYGITACLTEEGWVLSGGAVWDFDGTLLQSFPTLTQPEENNYVLSDGRAVGSWERLAFVEKAYWINEDLLALDAKSRVFLYRISTDTLTLVDDMNSWMQKYGSLQVYYGVDIIQSYAGPDGFYYFAHKDEEESNSSGTVWLADESGSRVLFDGIKFSNFWMRDGVILLDRYDEEDPSKAQLWYATATEKAVHDLGVFSFRQPVKIDDGRILFESVVTRQQENDSPEETTVLTCIFIESGEIVQHDLGRVIQTMPLGSRMENGSLQLLYETFLNGITEKWLYDTGTGETRSLPDDLPAFTDSELPPGQRFYCAVNETGAVQVRPLP